MSIPTMEYFPSDTIFHRLHPLPKFIYWFAITLIPATVFSDPIVVSMVLIFGVVLPYRLAKIPLKYFVDSLQILPVILPLYVFFTLGFFASPPESRIYFYLIPPLGFGAVTLDSIIWLVAMILRLTCIITVFRLIPHTTTVSDIMRMLTQLKVPMSLALTFALGLAYVPLMMNEARMIQDAQKSRGQKIGGRNPIRRSRELMGLVIPLLAISIRRSSGLAEAILSRGYGYGKRTYFKNLRFRKSDYLAIIVVIAIIAVFLSVVFFRHEYVSYTLTANLIRSFAPGV